MTKNIHPHTLSVPKLSESDLRIRDAFEDHVIEAINETSGKMYDEFYNLLAQYQFDFSPYEKKVILRKIFKEITAITEDADK